MIVVHEPYKECDTSVEVKELDFLVFWPKKSALKNGLTNLGIRSMPVSVTAKIWKLPGEIPKNKGRRINSSTLSGLHVF